MCESAESSLARHSERCQVSGAATKNTGIAQASSLHVSLPAFSAIACSLVSPFLAVRPADPTRTGKGSSVPLYLAAVDIGVCALGFMILLSIDDGFVANYGCDSFFRS